MVACLVLVGVVLFLSMTGDTNIKEMSNTSHDNVLQLFSDEEREIYDIINFSCIISIITIFGMVANVINIVVFYKQGFSNTMNISFFGLAISDMCGLVTLLWGTICVNPLFVHSDVPIVAHDVHYVTSESSHSIFARITGWITVYITAERCLCIMLPLKIKQIITPNRTIVIVCVIYIFIMASLLPEYATTYIDWSFHPEKNKSLLGFAFTENREIIESFVFITYSFLGSVSFIAVIVFTACLIIQLKRKSKWRREAKIDEAKSELMSNRERKTVTMVVMIATVLIVCYMPGTAVSMVTFFVSEFSVAGELVNSFFVFWSFAFIFEALNSSVNIFLYYKMSSKYRETFHQIVCNLNTE